MAYPSWYSSLLAGQYLGSREEATGGAQEKAIYGALLVDIGDDPDLIDASGGYNSGCYIKSIDPAKGGIWLEAGLQSTWIIQKINEDRVGSISDLEGLMGKYHGRTVTLTAVRNYTTRTFEMKIPKR